MREARDGIGRMLAGQGDAVDDQAIREIGTFQQALLTGVMAQHLIDPENAPAARELAQALTRISGR